MIAVCSIGWWLCVSALQCRIVWERIILHHIVFHNEWKNAIVVVNIVAIVVIVTAVKYWDVCRERNDFQMKDSEETESLG
jgi:hypothetical protein